MDPLLLLHLRIVLTQLHVARDEDGQGLTEYALILALIAVVAIVALKLLSTKVDLVLSTIANSL
jgi:Flp pilus assembly pilin Flp